MKRKSIVKRVASLAAALAGVAVCGLTSVIALAEDTQDKLDSANTAIDNLRKEQKNISGEISELNEQADAAGRRINELNDDIIDKQDDISLVNEEIAGIEDDMELRYDDMKLRIRYIYESGDLGLTEAIVSSGEFSELLNRAEYIQRIYDYDRNELEAMADLYLDREDKKNILESEMADLEDLKASADAEARSLERLLTEKKDELKLSDEKLSELEALALKYEKQLEEERLAREEEERRKQEEAEKKAKEEAARKAAAEAAEKKARGEAARAQTAQTKAAQTAEQTTATQAPTTAAPATTQAPTTTAAPATQPAAAPTASSSSSSSGSSYSQNDLAMLAAIIECEAGNQPYEGRLAVGSVVLNRVESSKFPNSISGVIYQSGQFSPVASGRFAACLARGASDTNVSAARDVLGGVRNVPYLFFRVYSGYVGNYSSYTVMWDHIFYNY